MRAESTLNSQGKSSPSSGMHLGKYWKNASDSQSGIRVPSIALWVNSTNTDGGHALFIERYDADIKAYKIHEANWDNRGNMRAVYREDIKNMYPNKIWKGCLCYFSYSSCTIFLL